MRRIEFNRLALRIDGLPRQLEGFRLLHLSDLHVREKWDPAYEALLDRIAADPPDLIAITGDLIDTRWLPERVLQTMNKFCRRLTSRLGVLGILGNHDGDLLAEPVRSAGVELLAPGRAWYGDGDAGVEIIGLPAVARYDLKPRVLASMPPKPPRSLRVVLSHYPDAVERLGNLTPDLVLAGHTHGGQIRLPGKRPLITHDSLPKRISAGLHRYSNTWLLINRGMGFATHRIRINCPAEVIEITFSA
jgi:predicted MPP superfamily phosphohydrolase